MSSHLLACWALPLSLLATLHDAEVATTPTPTPKPLIPNPYPYPLTPNPKPLTPTPNPYTLPYPTPDQVIRTEGPWRGIDAVGMAVVANQAGSP